LLRGNDAGDLKRAGCQTVWIGAESGSQKILNAMEKGTQVEQIREASRRLHEAGIAVGFFLQFGYPGETRADIEQTLQMVRDCRPDDIGMSVSYPLPGTPFFERVKEQLGKKQNWLDSADLAMMYQGPFTTAFYRQLHTVLHKEFRARKTWEGIRGGRPASGTRGKWLQAREIGRLIYRLATLPIARWRLERLARLPHEGMAQGLPMVLSLEEAARPTPQ
jgi:radical SAM superfamily enzyme YgiQ (UPF0313 family)